MLVWYVYATSTTGATPMADRERFNAVLEALISPHHNAWQLDPEFVHAVHVLAAGAITAVDAVAAEVPARIDARRMALEVARTRPVNRMVVEHLIDGDKDNL